MRLPRPTIGSAHLLAIAAILIALGGTSYAAVKLGKGQVKAKNIAAKAVTGKKIASGAVTTEKLADGSVTGKKIAPATINVDRLSAAARNELSSEPQVLPSGATVKGSYVTAFTAAGSSEIGAASFSFGANMSATPDTEFIAAGGSPTADCAGAYDAPTAAPGNLCIYEINGYNRNISLTTPGTMGGFLYFYSAGPGDVLSVGTWAATAP